VAIYEITPDKITALPQTTFAEAGLLERLDLQRLLREQIEVVAPDTLVISEEFGDWQDSRRRIDLLAVDRDANLVVIELKRTEDGGHMELQALRYAAMVSTMTLDRAASIYARHLGAEDDNARARLLEFLGWDGSEGEHFAPDVRIVLVSAEFSQELTTSVLWLNKRDLDIRCVRLRPYRDGSRVLLDVSQVIPLPEESTYQVRLREKEEAERRPKRNWDRSSFLQELRASGAETSPAERVLAWAEAKRVYVRWGNARSGAFRCLLRVPPHDHKYLVCVVRAEGKIVLRMDILRSKAALREGPGLAQFQQAVAAIPGVSLRGDLEGRVWFRIDDLMVPGAFDAFESALDRLVTFIRSWHQDNPVEQEAESADDDS